MAYTVLIQVIILSLMMLLGYILGKLGYIREEHSVFLTNLVMDVFFPASVLAAASHNFGDGNKRETFLIIVFYFGILLVYTFLGWLVSRFMGLNTDERRVFACSAGYPNNGFMGLPLCSAVFGSRGALWSALSIPGTTFYIFVVLTLIFRRGHEQGGRGRIKSLCTPLNIAATVMIVMLVTGWKLEGPVLSAADSLGGCTTPVGMLLVGYLLSASPLIDALRRPAVYVVTLLRNILLPLFGAVIFSFTAWDRHMCLCMVMVLGCNVAATVSMFAARYNRAREFASQSMLQSTLLLPVTMPLMIFFAEKILQVPPL